MLSSTSLLDPLISSMTCQELLQFRQCSGFAYKYISIDVVKRKVLQLAQNRLRIMFGDKYAGLVNILKKWDVEIVGPWVTQLFYDEDWDVQVALKYLIPVQNDTDIIFDPSTQSSGSYIDGIIAKGYGILDDFIKLETQIVKTGDTCFEQVNGQLHFVCAGRYIKINGYEIKLYMNSNKKDKYYTATPIKLFRSVISVWDVKIYDMIRIVNKCEIIDLYAIGVNDDIFRYSSKFGIKLCVKRIHSLRSYVGGNEMDLLVLYDDDRTLLFDHCIRNVNGDCQWSESIKSSYGDIQIKEHNNQCSKTCRYNYLGIEHSHKYIMRNDDERKYYVTGIFIKYGKVSVTDNLKEKFESATLSDFIDFEDLDDYDIWE